MKIQQAKDLEAACHEAACQLNEAIAAACHEGMIVQIEVSERRAFAEPWPVVFIWPKCTVKPSNLEI